MAVLIRAIAASTLFALALVGCGGGKTNATTSTKTASSQPMTESQRESAALPRVAVAPVPNGLNCGATRPVWVNQHTKVYHELGDPYYGRTKNGQYMCPSAAASQGYHAARHRGSSNPMDNGASTHSEYGASGNATPDSQATPRSRHHRHKSSNNY